MKGWRENRFDSPIIKKLFHKNFGESSISWSIGGDRIQDLAWRLNNGKGITSLLRCSIQNIFLLIGTNDIGVGESVGHILSEYSLLVLQLYVSFTFLFLCLFGDVTASSFSMYTPFCQNRF